MVTSRRLVGFNCFKWKKMCLPVAIQLEWFDQLTKSTKPIELTSTNQTDLKTPNRLYEYDGEKWRCQCFFSGCVNILAYLSASASISAAVFWRAAMYFWLYPCQRVCNSNTGIGQKACTWLREIYSCSCLTLLPGPAWVLLNNICMPFSRSLYTWQVT